MDFDWLLLPSILWAIETIYYTIVFESFLQSILKGCVNLESELRQKGDYAKLNYENDYKKINSIKENTRDVTNEVRYYKNISIFFMLFLPLSVALGLAINAVIVICGKTPLKYDIFSIFPTIISIFLLLFCLQFIVKTTHTSLRIKQLRNEYFPLRAELRSCLDRTVVPKEKVKKYEEHKDES